MVQTAIDSIQILLPKYSPHFPDLNEWSQAMLWSGSKKGHAKVARSRQVGPGQVGSGQFRSLPKSGGRVASNEPSHDTPGMKVKVKATEVMPGQIGSGQVKFRNVTRP